MSPKLVDAWIGPESTPARVPFGNPPDAPGFDKSAIVVYGVPFDDTATFGKGTSRGPEAIRHVSARQVETYIVDERIDLYEKLGIHDMGDLKLQSLSDADRALLQNESASDSDRAKVVRKLQKIMEQFDALKDLTKYLREQNKIPLMLGGEHTLSYWPLTALADEEPVVLHFDAHRDAKAEYMGMRMSHTTPMYHVIKEQGKRVEFVQIGIRQTDREEQDFAERSGVVTFYPRDVREKLPKIKDWIHRKTKGRAVYVTFDIDALDISYTPCTGTPEPFGLTPEEAVEIFRAVHPSARLVGADMMEVAVKNNDYREATTATQLLLRLLARDYVRR
jgi:agmatinase